MSLKLYEMSGGNPMLTEGQVTVGAGAQTTTVLTVASGKRCIPAWFVLWGNGTATATVRFLLRGQATLSGDRKNVIVDRFYTYVQFMQPQIFKFGMSEMYSLGDGENLWLTTLETDPGSDTTGDVYYYSMGYYLVDT